MPATTIFVLGAVVAAFASLALTLAWVGSQTSPVNQTPVANTSRRRPF